MRYAATIVIDHDEGKSADIHKDISDTLLVGTIVSVHVCELPDSLVNMYVDTTPDLAVPLSYPTAPPPDGDQWVWDTGTKQWITIPARES